MRLSCRSFQFGAITNFPLGKPVRASLAGAEIVADSGTGPPIKGSNFPVAAARRYSPGCKDPPRHNCFRQCGDWHPPRHAGARGKPAGQDAMGAMPTEGRYNVASDRVHR